MDVPVGFLLNLKYAGALPQAARVVTGPDGVNLSTFAFDASSWLHPGRLPIFVSSSRLRRP